MAGSLNFRGLDELIGNVRTYDRKLVEAVAAILERWAQQLVATAKGSHPWTNRTGAAEASLNGGILREAAGEIVTLYLQHGIEYGWWLETKYGGKWGVVVPVLEASYGPIMAELQALVR